MYFPHSRVNLLPVPGPLLPVPEEYMLHFPFVRKRVVVRVKEHDRFLSCLAFEKRFPQSAC